MNITKASASDLEPTVDHLAAAFADDPLMKFLYPSGPDYRERLKTFFSLLMGARLALDMPVLVARDEAGSHGAAMGYTTARPAWPSRFAEEWDRFEQTTPGLHERMALYEELVEKGRPQTPHYYLGVLGLDPALHGRGIGKELLLSYCDLSASDELSSGVYLETANPPNVPFYERAGFEVTAHGSLGSANLWCMFLPHATRKSG